MGGRPGFEVVPFAETIGSFEALRDGAVDAVLNDYFNSIALISERFDGELAIPRRWGGPWLIVRARLVLADGTQLGGYLTPPVQGDSGLGTLQPTVVIGDQTIVGFKEKEIREALA